jgi:hypothetical protein
MSGKSSELFDRARKQVERQMAEQENEVKRSLMKKRIEFVTQGLRALSKQNVAEAILGFRNYIKLLEDFKGVDEGALTPSNFDNAKEFGDLLLLSGVYWELTKLYDRTKSEEKKKLFLHFMEKFISFSKSTSIQALCAENLRRYLSQGKAAHRAEFKNAYKVLGKGKCFVVSSLIDVIDFETLPAFWAFRDEFLARRAWGRVLIRVYYAVGPAIARLIDALPEGLRRKLGRALDQIAKRLT